jgi:multidrug efflux system membrane fusion protein
MAQIDPRPFQQALMQAQGTRQRDEAQLENARITLQRYQTLLAQDSIARQDVDTQAALVRQLEGTVTTDRAAEKTAQLNLDFTRVVAPVAGRVGLRVVDAGNVVSSSDTAGIAVITQVNPIDVEFSVPQDRVPEVAEAASDKAANRMPVTALDRTRARVLDKGQFLTLDNQVDVQTGTVRAKARFRNADNTLFPNQFVNVRLLLRTLEGALVVPVTALRTGPKGDFVYVINEDRTVSMREVKRGQAAVDSVVITRGLQKDERVVTEGGDRLQDGATVRLASDAPGGPGARPGASAPRDGASGPRRRRPPQNP